MVKSVRVHTVGGHHHIQLEDVELPHPGYNEVEVRHKAIGLNYLDVEACKGGGHHSPHSIFTPGICAVGIITELGTGVINHQIGERVGYVNPPNRGAFSEANVVPISCLIPLPYTLSDDEAALILFQGFTAWMLLRKLHPLRRGDAVLVHNAESGLGSIISQWANHLKAFVIGTVRSEAYIERAKKNGCDEVIVKQAEEFSSSFSDDVKELTGGEGVAIAVGLVGKNTLMRSIDCLAPRGMLVSLGATAGETPVLNLKDLAGRSFSIAFPVLADYVKHQEDLLEGAQVLFGLHVAGTILVQIGKKFPLNNIKEALEAVAGEAWGSCILIPPIPEPQNTPHGS